jgi:hypothetical protein
MRNRKWAKENGKRKWAMKMRHGNGKSRINSKNREYTIEMERIVKSCCDVKRKY